MQFPYFKYQGYRRALLLALFMALSATATSQDAETIDEVVVYGEKTLLTLRGNFRRTEDAFLAKFNDLNTDPMLEIDCETKPRLEDRRRIRVCTPRFYRKLEANSTASMIDRSRLRGSSAGGIQFQEAGFERRRKEMNEKLTREMIRLMQENPEFFESYQAMSAAKSEYESFQENRRKERAGAKDDE